MYFKLTYPEMKRLVSMVEKGITMLFGTKHSVQLSYLHDSVPRHILLPLITKCHYYALLL